METARHKKTRLKLAREYNATYRKTARGIEAGRKASLKYSRSAKGKAKNLAYGRSPKGKAIKRAAYRRRRKEMETAND